MYFEVQLQSRKLVSALLHLLRAMQYSWVRESYHSIWPSCVAAFTCSQPVVRSPLELNFMNIRVWALSDVQFSPGMENISAGKGLSELSV